jgi:hypothetical protein
MPAVPPQVVRPLVKALVVTATGAAGGYALAQTNQGTKQKVPEYPREKARDTLPKEDRPTSTNNNELGKWAEDQVDAHLKSQGWERVGGNTGKAGAQGIDGVYKRTNENGEDEYIVVETKYNTSDYGVRKDGTKQMSDEWIEDNLPKAVQDRDALTDIQNRGYTKSGYRVFPDGSIYKEQAPH